MNVEGRSITKKLPTVVVITIQWVTNDYMEIIIAIIAIVRSIIATTRPMMAIMSSLLAFRPRLDTSYTCFPGANSNHLTSLYSFLSDS